MKYPRFLRLWHWLNALVISGSLLTVLLNSSLLDVGDNTQPFYVLLNPVTQSPIVTPLAAEYDAQKYLAFLKSRIAAHNEIKSLSQEIRNAASE